jgi:AcrR family transcriptional regulator
MTAESMVVKPRGRPRSEDVDHGIHEAVLDTIARAGIAAVSIEGVATLAGVGKASIYRRFNSKDELIVASLIYMGEQNLPLRLTGTSRDQLIALLTGLRQKMSQTREGRIMLAVVGSGHENPELAALVFERIVMRRRDALRKLIEEGIASGEFESTIDVNTAVSTLVGSIIYLGMWSTQKSVDAARTEDVVDMVLR